LIQAIPIWKSGPDLYSSKIACKGRMFDGFISAAMVTPTFWFSLLLLTLVIVGLHLFQSSRNSSTAG
jgi:ABC-type dipeptide/oligopeptide/nickel transport system permease component